MKQNQVHSPVATMCRLLGVSTSGCYVWSRRKPSKRSKEDARLRKRLRVLHAMSQSIYGAPRLLLDLQEEGTHIGRKRVARLLRAEG